MFEAATIGSRASTITAATAASASATAAAASFATAQAMLAAQGASAFSAQGPAAPGAPAVSGRDATSALSRRFAASSEAYRAEGGTASGGSDAIGGAGAPPPSGTGGDGSDGSDPKVQARVQELVSILDAGPVSFVRAIEEIGAIGPDAKKAVGALLYLNTAYSLFNSSAFDGRVLDISSEAFGALHRIGPSAVPEIFAWLRQQNWGVFDDLENDELNELLRGLLEDYAPFSVETLQAGFETLFTDLQNNQPSTRGTAAEAINIMVYASARLMINALTGDGPRLEGDVHTRLFKLLGEGILPHLDRVRTFDKNWRAADSAKKAFELIEKEVIQGLIGEMGADDPLVRLKLADALKAFGTLAAPALAASKVPGPRKGAIVASTPIKREASQSVLDDLIKQLRNHDGYLIPEKLIRIGPEVPGFVASLFAALEYSDSDTLSVAAEVLSKVQPLGPEAEAALVLKGLPYENWKIRAASIIALGAVRPVTPLITQALTDMATTGEDYVMLRQAAIRALGRMSRLGSVSAPHALPTLLHVAGTDQSPLVRQQAIAELLDADPSAEGVMPTLIAALKDKGGKELYSGGIFHVNVRGTALSVLREFGPAVKEAAPALVELLQEQDAPTELRENAFDMLNRIDPAAAAAVYKATLNSPESSAGRRILTALRMLVTGK